MRATAGVLQNKKNTGFGPPRLTWRMWSANPAVELFPVGDSQIDGTSSVAESGDRNGVGSMEQSGRDIDLFGFSIRKLSSKVLPIDGDHQRFHSGGSVLKEDYPFGTGDTVELSYYPMIEVESLNRAELRTQARDGNCDGGEDGIKYSRFAA